MKIEEFFRPESVQTKHPLFLIKKAFIIERDSAAAKAAWMSLDDQEGSRVQTEVADKADGDKTIVTGEVKLTDVVEYKGLVEGDVYTVNGILMARSAGEALTDSQGNAITATAEFTAKASESTVEVTFEFDAPAHVFPYTNFANLESLASSRIESRASSKSRPDTYGEAEMYEFQMPCIMDDFLTSERTLS